MKKIRDISIVCAVIAVLCCLLVACNDKHDFSTDWSADDTYHWHACVQDGCEEVSEKGEHTFDDGVITAVATPSQSGVKTFTCTVCGRTETEEVPYVPVRTVAEKEWIAALELDNFNNCRTLVVSNNDEDAEEYKFAPAAFSKSSVKGEDYSVVDLEYGEATVCEYSYKDGKWSAVLSYGKDFGIEEAITSVLFVSYYDYDLIKVGFGNFKFNEGKGVYEYIGGKKVTVTDGNVSFVRNINGISCGFEDGKLVSFEYDYGEDGGSGSFEVVYGKQTVVFPEEDAEISHTHCFGEYSQGVDKHKRECVWKECDEFEEGPHSWESELKGGEKLYTCSDCGKERSVKTAVADEEEWKKAFSESNYVDCLTEKTDSFTNTDKETKITENALYTYNKSGTNGVIQMTDGEEITMYMLLSGKWQKTSVDYSESQWNVFCEKFLESDLFGNNELGMNWVGMYSSFTYDDTDGLYKYSGKTSVSKNANGETVNYTIKEIVIGIEDGKLAYLKVAYASNGQISGKREGEITVSVSYGKQVIELPNI